MITLINTSNNKLGFWVQLSFQLTQHTCDIKLTNHNFIKFVISNFSDSTEKIILFSLKKKWIWNCWSKISRLCRFKKVACIIKNKAHLTSEEFDLIKKIKASKNKGRQLAKLLI
jgi:hypothetical protein